jgi:L-lactate dehydrogenase complex protein LldF
VKINIPEILIHLRSKVVEGGNAALSERMAMKAAALSLAGPARFSLAQKLVRIGQWPFERDGVLHDLPGMLAGWTDVRDLPAVPKESFREWWRKRQKKESA